ncbi:MAG: hypothetical protein E5V53_14915, partial [Mesorhizobium sp.]
MFGVLFGCRPFQTSISAGIFCSCDGSTGVEAMTERAAILAELASIAAAVERLAGLLTVEE